LVGQIARAAAIYHVDEIVVFNDRLGKDIKPHFRNNFRKRDDSRTRADNRAAAADANAAHVNADANNNANKASDGNINGNNDDEKEKEPEQRLQASADPHAFMARILQYCECPQYLRRHFFPMHPDLQFAGLLAPLDAPHHVRALDRSPFREGVVMDKKGNGPDAGSLVDCGIRNQPVE